MSTATAKSDAGGAVKILTVGPVNGQIRSLISKLTSINAKHGPFECVLCTGDFFNDIPLADEQARAEASESAQTIGEDVEALLRGELEVPLPCFIMQGSEPIPSKIVEKFASSGSEIAKNVILLSKSGLTTMSQGLRIACLGGIYDETVYNGTDTPLGFTDPYFSSQTIAKLTANINTSSPPAPAVSVSSSTHSKPNSLAAFMERTTGSTAPSPARFATQEKSHLVDILISNVWPSSIGRFTSMEGRIKNAVPPLDDLIRLAKPRYYFASSPPQNPEFWEREPFVWHDEAGRVTRFVNLGSFGDSLKKTDGKKQRWFYAFSIAPPSNATQPAPHNATQNPFTIGGHWHKRPPPDPALVDDGGVNFRFGTAQRPNKKPRNDKGGEPGKPPPGYRCKRCDSTEHYISDCPQRDQPPEGYVCRICNNEGHFLRDCPEKNQSGDTGGKKPPPGYVCRACASEGHYIQDCPVVAEKRVSGGGNRGDRRREPRREIGPDECWFCLSNPHVAKHLIVSIGSECYLTLPKGQIVPSGEGVRGVPGGGHVLIVPISHYPTLNSMPPEHALPIVEEIEKYKSSLRDLYAHYNCALVTFEVGILSGKGGHAHVQCVPIPTSYTSAQIGSAFIDAGQRTGGIEFVKDAEADQALARCSGGRGNYFRVDLPDSGKLVHLITQQTPSFSVQFGRHVLCDLLGLQERMDWKACAQSEGEEREDAVALKKALAPYDKTQA